MTRPTNSLKVDNAVHSELKRLKGKHNVSTFNDVLRHELDIIPDANIDELAAFLPEELREVAHEVVEVIESVDDFACGVEEGDYDKKYLTFSSTNTERKIAQVGFDESDFTVHYLNNNREMDECGLGRKYSSGEIQYGTSKSSYDHIDPKEVLESVETKITGSNRRWGSD